MGIPQLIHHLACHCSEQLESELFGACVSCGTSVGKQIDSNQEAAQVEIKSLFKDIRFGSMSLKEWTGVSNSNPGLFSYDEYKDVVCMIASEDFQSSSFNSNRQKRIDISPYDDTNAIYRYRLASIFLQNENTSLKT